MTLISVPDMSCGHCKASITAALSPLVGVQTIAVDLAKRQVDVSGTAQADVILNTLDEIGFPAQVISAS